MADPINPADVWRQWFKENAIESIEVGENALPWNSGFEGPSYEIKDVSFHLEKGEIERLNAWNMEHLSKFHKDQEPYTGAIGGRLVFKFASNGIGVSSWVRCGCCRDTDWFDLTDYDSW